MSSIKCVGNLDGERQDKFGVQWPTTNVMFQRQSVQKLHGDEGFAMLVIDFVDRANVEHSQNVGMIQGRGGLRLSFKAS